MFVKTKESAGRTLFYLCIAEDGGSGGRGWKSVEYSVCLGDTLDLSSTRWLEILRSSSVFQSVPLLTVLEVLEQYAEAHGLSFESLAGLREAARGAKQKSHRRVYGDKRSQQDARVAALHLLGLLPGSSDDEIESAFRKAARRHHPDVGGDPAKFRSIVDARNFLLGRETRISEPA